MLGMFYEIQSKQEMGGHHQMDSKASIIASSEKIVKNRYRSI